MIEFLKDGIKVGEDFYSLNEIRSKCLEVKTKEEDFVILRMEWVIGRNFDGILERYACKKEDAVRLKSILSGRYIYFGEINGKHSEVYGNLEESEISIIDDSKEILDFLLENPSGHHYNHSFLYKFSDMLDEYDFEDLKFESEEEREELEKIFKEIF